MTPDVLERVGAGDRHADYCLWDYGPAASAAGKLRSSSLLWAFLTAVGWPDDVRACCEGLRRTLGAFQTVWGIKQRDGRYQIELYFYDYARLERTVSVGRVASALAPFVDLLPHVPDARPYFMFSIDLDPDVLARRRIEEFSLYIGNPGSSVSSGICYNVSPAGLRLDNLYSFFDRATQGADIRAKLACSAHTDLRSYQPEAVLQPNLMTCGVVVVANKRHNDGVYFSRLPLPGFLAFIRQAHLPASFVRFVDSHRGEFDHLLFDVGFDYVSASGGVEMVKTAIYGLL